MHRHEPELADGGGVSRARDEDGAEPLERGLAGVPVAERKERMHRSPSAVALERAFVGGRHPLGLGELLGVPPCPSNVEEGAVGLLRRVDEVAREPIDEDRRAAVDDRERVPPETKGESETEVGDEQRVRPLARKEGGRPGYADDERVERLVELGSA